jgi:hypothetical protein
LVDRGREVLQRRVEVCDLPGLPLLISLNEEFGLLKMSMNVLKCGSSFNEVLSSVSFVVGTLPSFVASDSRKSGSVVSVFTNSHASDWFSDVRGIPTTVPPMSPEP